MSMTNQLIAAVQYHRVLGYIIKPYLAEYMPATGLWKIRNSITAQDIKAENWPESKKTLVEKTGNYSDTEILRRFAQRKNKKPEGIREFYNSLTTGFIENHIQPFVQKTVYEIVEIIKETDTPLFYKEKQGINQQLAEHIQVMKYYADSAFHFSHTDEGIRYSIHVLYRGKSTKLKDRSHIFLSMYPCALIINDKLFTFKDIDGNKLKPFFNKEYILVPKKLEKEYFKGFVRKIIRDYPVIAEGFDVIDSRPEPALYLTIAEDLLGHYSLQLSFGYPGKTVYPNNARHHIIFMQNDNGRYKYHRIIRDYQLEQKAFEKLLKSGLKTPDNFNYYPSNKEKAIPGLISWINTHYDSLKKTGFVINTSDELPEYILGPFRLDIQVQSEINDWFDIYALVKAGKFEIPFIHLRKHLLKGEKFYKLPDGTIFIIPDEWFEQYADLMTYAQKGEEDSLLIRKYHYTLLKDAGIEKQTRHSEDLEHLYTQRIEKDLEPPAGLKARLRSYQKEGYAWLYHLHQHGFGGCLADDMGLGKTVQALALLLKAAAEEENVESAPAKPKTSVNQLSLFGEVTEEKQQPQTSLVIMPTSLVHNWETEIDKFAPQLKVLVYRGKREGLIERFPDYDIVLTSYGVARIDSEALKKFSFFYIILDESQYVKNPESKTYKAITDLVSDYRMVLTGTPIENSLTDLWAQLNFLNEGLLGNYSNFIEKFVSPIEKKKDKAQEEKLNRIIRPFLLRRKKLDVAKELPPLSEQVYYCEMTEEQQTAYERYKSGIRNKLIDNLLDRELQEHRMQVLEALLRLRQMSNHPVLADEDYDGDSGKFNEVIRTIESLRAEGNKAIFFSSFVEHLKLIAHYLRQQGYPFAMLTGQTRNRQEEVRKFQEEKDIKFFLISLKAGGTGLNLTAAGYVFILDPWWNPAAEAQALNRAHRIGQEKNVFVYRLISRGSIEEKIYKLQERKSKLAETFINSNDPFKNMSAGDIKELFR